MAFCLLSIFSTRFSVSAFLGMFMKSKKEKGFTLIELLVVVATISILAGLGIPTLWSLKSNAAYAVAEDTLRGCRNSGEAGLATAGGIGGLGRTLLQTQADLMGNANAKAYLAGMVVPTNVSIEVEYDPTCLDGGCTTEYVQVKHCNGQQYLNWTRFGDGSEIYVRNIAGDGC